MSIDKVREYLKQYKLDNNILEFEESSATVAEAALRLNCTEGEIAKSLSFIVSDTPIIIVVAGDKKIDNSKYKKEFNTKARMIEYDNVEKITGHKVGGVCPFAINNNVKVYLDISLKEYSYVYPACGSSNSAIKLSIEQLEHICNYIKWIDVCK